MNKTGVFLIGYCFFILFTVNAIGSPYDSLGITKKAGQTFIIHQIEEGETLYSLSRRYGVSVDLISQENPEVKSGLKIGQKVLVPVVKKKENKTEGTVHKVQPSETLYSIARKYNVTTEQIVKWNSLSDNNIKVGQELVIKESNATINTQPEETINYSGKKTHTVAESETLYSLSKQYDVSIEDLKKFNKMDGNELSIGQVLIVSSTGAGATTNSSMLPSNVEQSTQIENVNTDNSINVSEIKTPVVAVGPTSNEEQTMDSKKIKETGFAQVIEGSSETKKYLALHKSAPLGTIMQVKNTMNNQTVFVRVVGVLPNTGENDKVLLKISKKAFDRLGAVDAKFPVEISYVP